MSAHRSLTSIRRFATILLTAQLLSSCTYWDIMTGKERTEPDGGQNSFAEKRAPVLNPGGSLYHKEDTKEEAAARAENPYVAEGDIGQSEGGGARRVPIGNQAAFNDNRPTPVGAYRQSAPVRPVTVSPPFAGPQSSLAPQSTVASWSAFPASAPESDAMPAPKAPVVMAQSAPPLPAAMHEAAPAVPKNASYPALSATPANPARPDMAAQKAEMERLRAQQDIADAARDEMMSDPEVTDMRKQSAGSAALSAAPAKPAVASAPVEPIAAPFAPKPAAAAAPAAFKPAEPAVAAEKTPAPAPKSESSFSQWLNRMFSSDSSAKESNQASASAPVTPVQPAPVISDAAPKPVSAVTASAKPLEPIHLTPPADMDAEPEDIASIEKDKGAQPAPAISAPSQAQSAFMAASTAQPLEPIRLSAPPAIAAAPSDVAQQDDSAEPIALAPPANTAAVTGVGSGGGRYLADNRYASRRVH
jgi:hypothetical protein